MRTTCRLGWLLLLLACLLPAACQSPPQQVGPAGATPRPRATDSIETLSLLNLAASLDVAREKNAEAPPRRFPDWPSNWRHHFATLHVAPPGRDRNDDAWREVAGLHLAFVKQKRAEAGLPPFD